MPTQVMQECRSHLDSAKKLLIEILEAKSVARNESNLLVPYNQLAMHLDAAGSIAGLMSNVHPDSAVRSEAEGCEQEISEFATELSLNRPLYEAFVAIDKTSLEVPSRRLHEKILQDFKRSGVDKDEATRTRIKALNKELVDIGQEFDRTIREDVRAIELNSVRDLDGLPEDYIEAHKPGANGKIKITTDYPDVIPFMSYAKSADARKRISIEFKNRGYPKNDEVFNRLLAKRYELAKLLGYANWAAYVTEDKMIRTAEAVDKFINEVAVIAKPRAEREYRQLLAEKAKDFPGATVVEDWEKAYYENSVKISQYSFDSKEARQYFDFSKTQKGLLDLCSELFALQFKKVTSVKTWHESVEVFEVYEAGSSFKLFGRIYLDLHPRDGKFKHAAQFTLRSGVAGKQIPEGVLVCNFPDPKSAVNGVALMEHGDVVTFFHEFGHLLHHVLGGHQKWIRFSGVATEWDFVEAPSQFFEEWAWDAKVLQRFALHAETRQPIPDDLVRRMKEAEDFGEGIAARQQMFYAAMSLKYHNQDPKSFGPLELLKDLQKQYAMFPYQEGTHFHLNFGHLNGYSAMYYTYMWSQVIAKDLLSAFQKTGLMNLELALKYRKTVLEPGGSKDAADLTKDFLGRPYSFEAFRAWLNGAAVV